MNVYLNPVIYNSKEILRSLNKEFGSSQQLDARLLPVPTFKKGNYENFPYSAQLKKSNPTYDEIIVWQEINDFLEKYFPETVAKNY